LYISDEAMERLLKEDVPYIDLTTLVLGIGARTGKIRFFSREAAVLCGTEEVLKIFNKLNVTVTSYLPSGTLLKKEETVFEAAGRAEDLHMGWKVSLNILEYCSGIATRTRMLVDAAKKINPKISVVTTRKMFPGTKDLAIKAILNGGGFPHRLGLSETILIFKQHLNFMGGLDGFLKNIGEVKSRACEKKIIVEVENLEDAISLCKEGIDGLQFDKVPPAELKEHVHSIRSRYPEVVLLAAGGINQNNVEDYAKTGVDAIVTTSVYFGKPVDMGASITGV
jgi:molybdenum transport protein